MEIVFPKESLPSQKYYEKNKVKRIIRIALFSLSIFLIISSSERLTGFSILNNMNIYLPNAQIFGFFLLLISLLLLNMGKTFVSLEKMVGEVDFIETAKGSKYKYLPDGRTQRFKKTEGKNYEPQDILLFIPDWETIQKIAPKDLIKRGIFGENDVQYDQELLNYLHKGRISIVNKEGDVLKTKRKINDEKGTIFLAFQEKGKDIADFVIPVSRMPQLGYYAFDRRNYKKDDEDMTERHIGHQVIKIGYKNGRIIS